MSTEANKALCRVADAALCSSSQRCRRPIEPRLADRSRLEERSAIAGALQCDLDRAGRRFSAAMLKLSSRRACLAVVNL
jgi:hypothetical protein